MLKRLILIILVFLGASALSATLCANISRADGEDLALKSYHQGLSAKTIGEREQSIEKALALYLTRFNSLKEEEKMNGWLCYNIGNCYFNLKQAGEAIYYYRLALSYLPNDEKISSNLEVALSKRDNGVDVTTGGIKETLLFFHYKIPTAKRITILIITAILTSCMLAGLILKPSTLFRYSASISSLALIALSLSIFAEYYFPNHIGVMIQTADIRRDAGSEFAPITTAPFTAGSTIRVQSLTNGWFEVKLNDGRKGFIQQEKIKLLM